MKDLRKTINRNVGHCNKELKTVKKSQSKLDNSIAKMKNELNGVNSKLNNSREQIGDPEARITKSPNQNSKQKDKWEKNESNICDLLDNIKHGNLCIIGITEREERKNGIENIFEEIMAENSPNLKTKMYIQV